MKENDLVTWTHAYRRGRSVNFTTRKGKIIQFIGSHADVKYRGEVYRIKLDRLRPEGDKTELTEWILR